jgi:hypothetical protein
MQAYMREAYVKDGRAFTETEVQRALYEMLKAVSQGQTGGGPMVMAGSQVLGGTTSEADVDAAMLEAIEAQAPATKHRCPRHGLECVGAKKDSTECCGTAVGTGITHDQPMTFGDKFTLDMRGSGNA